MRTKIALAVAFFVIFVTAMGFSQNLVKNGSFETPSPAYGYATLCEVTNSPYNNSWCWAPSGFAGMEWKVVWTETVGLSLAGSDGNLEFWHNFSVTPVDGSQVVELDTDGRTGTTSCNVKIFQEINTCPGASYNLSYFWRPRFDDATGSESVTLSWAGTNLITHSDPVATWRQATRTVIAGNGRQELAFTEGGTGDHAGMLLDNVVLTGPDANVAGACGTAINIKPGSDPNSINVCAEGSVPVVIWGSPTFDVNTIDPTSLKLGNALVKVVGKSDRYLCSIGDKGSPAAGVFDNLGDPDGIPDLTCHFQIVPNMFEGSTVGEVTMDVCTGGFNAGCDDSATTLKAADAINIVREGCQ